MGAPSSVEEIVPARNARLLLESSQAKPPSSQQSFQKATPNLTDSTVSLLLRVTLPPLSTSLPPYAQRRGYQKLGGSPKLCPSACPTGWPLAFSFLPRSRYSSHVSGNLLYPTASNHDLR